MCMQYSLSCFDVYFFCILEPGMVTSLCNGTTEATFANIENKLTQELYLSVLKMGFTNLTEIQTRVFDILLGSDTLPSIKAIAKTGSGKTLAYLLPLVQMVNDERIKDHTGKYALCWLHVLMA